MAELDTIDYASLVRHVRRMLTNPDAFSILVRGLSLIDKALEALIDRYSAIGFKKLDDALRHPSLHEKTYIALALGAISDGERIAILRISKLRNNVAHRIDVELHPHDEKDIIDCFRENAKPFKGLNYDSGAFPRNLAFVLLVLFHSLHMRSSRPDSQSRAFTDDDSNTEYIAAITLTTTLVEVMKKGVETDDNAIQTILNRQVAEAKTLREDLQKDQAANANLTPMDD
jgi:hypothetical protein